MSKQNKTIVKNKLLLVEGADAFHFFLAALKIYKLDTIQIMDFGGIDDLSNFLTLLKAMDGFDNIETVVIARDAETNWEDAIKAIKSTLILNFKNTPNKPFEYVNTPIKLAYMLFPGYDIDNISLKNGTLEELCLETIDNEIKNKAINFVSELHKEEKFKYLHKIKLHSYLSITDKYVGSKIGEASKYGAWDWTHKSLVPYKKILEEM